METDFTSMIAIIAWLGGSFFCGLLPLAFAAVLFFTARKRGQVGSEVTRARRTSFAALQAGAEIVRMEGIIDPAGNGFDGPAESAVVYLRMKVEILENGDDGPRWQGFTEKTRTAPFRLNDGSGSAWVNPEGLDKQLLGEPFVPNQDQIQAACILLGIDPKMLRGRLRFSMWELKGGQKVSVVGAASTGINGMEIRKVPERPFIVSPLLGESLGANLTSQTKKASTWMYILGIPGILFLICGLGGALVSLIRLLGG